MFSVPSQKIAICRLAGPPANLIPDARFDPRQGVPVDTANTDTDVIVVGAGPSGLVAALELVRQDVRVRIVDRKPAPVDQSRATIVHARSLEVFDRFGVAEEALGAGVPILKVELHERGRSVATLPLADPGLEGRTRFPCAVSLEQSETERILAAALGKYGAQVEWSTALESLTDTPGGVEATVRHDDRTETIRARWLVGADGAGSTVRKTLGIPFEGTTYPQTGLLADVALDVDLPADRLRLNMTRGGFVGILPLHGDRYRLFGAVPPGFAQPPGEVPVSHEAYAALATDRLHAWFRDYFSVAGSLREVVWASLFRCHSRIAERYGSGHVFLMGDAAHVHNPAGGQGMNLGIGDGANLGWKLAAVVRGEAGRNLLDTYETERRPVTQKIMRATDRGFRAETTRNPVAMWMRMHVGIKLVGLTTRLPRYAGPSSGCCPRPGSATGRATHVTRSPPVAAARSCAPATGRRTRRWRAAAASSTSWAPAAFTCWPSRGWSRPVSRTSPGSAANSPRRSTCTSYRARSGRRT